MQLKYPAWVEVDLGALAHNASVLRRAIPAEARLGILVKANGYGHGLEMAARAALRGGADYLVVATLEEGLAVRRAGLDAPVLVVYPIIPSAVGQAVGAGLELSVSGIASTAALLDAWRLANEELGGQHELRVHVEIDSGMGRGGVAPERVLDLVAMVDETPATGIAGVWSHLADGSSSERSAQQAARFEAVLAQLADSGRALPPRHLVATEGIFVAMAPAYDMARVGLGFYGELGLDVAPSAEMAGSAGELRPALTVKARPVRLEQMDAGATVGYGSEWAAQRQSVVATLPIGYADGWARAYWPGASALVRGRRVPLIGRVSMDSVCADVTDVDEVGLDDEFVLLGAQGGERITANDLARLRNSIPNEVFCALGPRLPRVYLDAGRIVAVQQQVEHIEWNDREELP